MMHYKSKLRSTQRCSRKNPKGIRMGQERSSLEYTLLLYLITRWHTEIPKIIQKVYFRATTTTPVVILYFRFKMRSHKTWINNNYYALSLWRTVLILVQAKIQKLVSKENCINIVSKIDIFALICLFSKLYMESKTLILQEYLLFFEIISKDV